jgi:hypothetical protein
LTEAVQRAGAVSRALRPHRFARVLLAMTLAVQTPAAIVLGLSLSGAGVPLAPLVTLAAALVLNVPLGLLFAEGLTDRPTSSARVYAVELPYFTVWSACFAFLFLAPVAWIGSVLSGVPALPTLQWTFGGALCLATYGVWLRRVAVRVRRVDVLVPSLPAALDGYRIVQLSDLHVGTFAPARRARRWVARANALRPDLVALTGDLISSGSHLLEATAETLGDLRATDGVAFSPGNHDYFCDHDRFFALLRAQGVWVLRNEGRLVRRGDAALWVAGADDYWKRLADVERSMRGRPPGVPAVLLAHDPRLWAPARQRQVTLTLSGHTHGGQVAIPFFAAANLARSAFRHTTGAHTAGDLHLVVSNGLGTTGPPARLGAPPEIVLVTLRLGSLSRGPTS